MMILLMYMVGVVALFVTIGIVIGYQWGYWEAVQDIKSDQTNQTP